ncbi:DUF2267 domain-containing protein [Dactylosporangium sp. CA-092794]|uniref:DUF2267 domain-containing protein n=1 Tax=Dactylosporangium sp. CA-092794 TaxID=3239929 RepID=UPI003D8EBD29
MAVGFEQLLAPVRQSLGDERAARRAVETTLRTIAERIGSDEARHLVPALPPEAAPWLFTTGPAQGFGPVEFVGRVARREGVPREVAERHTAAVMTALGETLDDEAYRHLTARLPRSFAPLMPKGGFVGGAAASEFVATVAGRAGIPPAQAEPGTAAVLEVLARRIGADADDLTAFLPVRLHAALRRGRLAPAPQLTADEFIVMVMRLTGLTEADATRMIRAALSALRDAVDEDFFEGQVQLPGRYRELLRAP